MTAEVNQDVEAILRKSVETNVPPTFDETQTIKRELVTDDVGVKAELARMQRVVRHRLSAGSKESRQAVADEVERTANVLETEGPAIQKEIAELTQKLKGFQRDHEVASRRQEQIARAAEALRKDVPTTIRKHVEAAQQSARETHGAELNALKLERRRLDAIKSVNPTDPEKLVMIRTHCPAAVDDHNGRPVVNPKTWADFVRQETKREAKVDDALTKTQEAFDKAMADAQEPLDFYL